MRSYLILLSFIFSLCIIVITNCSFGEINSLKNNQGYVKKLNSTGTYTYKVSTSDKQYSLEVETTCVNDSLSNNENSDFKPLVIDQELIFKYKDSIIYKLNYPVKKIMRKLYNGKKLLMLENAMEGIGIVHGKYNSFYYVIGLGGIYCNSCSEFFGFFSLNGAELWCSYSYNNTKDIGDYTNTINEYGISDSLYKHDLIKMKTVYPPIKINTEIKISLVKK